jgi:hypothetical protein
MRFLAKKAPYADDRGRTYAGSVMDFTVRKVRPVEEPSDVPPLGQRPDLGRRTKIQQKLS